MRSFLTVPMALAAALSLAGVANAQTTKTTTSTPLEDTGYVEVVAQSAFGNVTSQSYGLEAGVTIRPQMQLFVEVGQTRNVATAELSAAAQLIAGALSRTEADGLAQSPDLDWVAPRNGTATVVPPMQPAAEAAGAETTGPDETAVPTFVGRASELAALAGALEKRAAAAKSPEAQADAHREIAEVRSQLGDDAGAFESLLHAVQATPDDFSPHGRAAW